MTANDQDQASDIAISVRGVSKKFQIKPGQGAALDTGEFIALNNVSFDLYKGESVGIIGSNGSGKTTLLKILSSITKPTAGEVRVHGHATSILDIGSNFHPDLSGRENTLMHLRLNNIPKDRQGELIREIQQFSGIGVFFEQPVKYYSNGMFLRLAFSVVFNLTADILILDEVLSVGDENFRMKSHHLIEQLRKQKRSILLVSHSRGEIMELCTRCIWLEKGAVRKIGPAAEVMSEYFDDQKQQFDQEIAQGENGHVLPETTNDGIDIRWPAVQSPGNEILSLKSVTISNLIGGIESLYVDEPVRIKVVIEKLEKESAISTLIMLHNGFNEPIVLAYNLNNLENTDYIELGKGRTGTMEYMCEIPPRLLSAGNYYLTGRFGRNSQIGQTYNEGDFHIQEVIKFRLRNKPGSFDFIGSSLNVAVRPALKWICREVTHL